MAVFIVARRPWSGATIGEAVDYRSCEHGFTKRVRGHIQFTRCNRQDAQDAKLPEPDMELDQVTDKNVAIGEARLDLLVADRLVELKACPSLLPEGQRSLAGLLINFNMPLLRQGIRRVIRTL